MTNKEIKNICFNNADISALYYGSVLVWEKQVASKNKLSGSFTSDSTGSDWWYKDGNGNKISLPVDPETKKFEIEIDTLKSCKSMFADNYKIHTIDEFPDTSEVTSMWCMFGGGSDNKLISINLENFNTQNVTNMYHLFSNRQGLTKLELPQTFDISNVTNMECSFGGLNGLKTLDLSMLNTKNVTNMWGLFQMGVNNKLQTINFGNNWDMSKVTNNIAMFDWCEYLTNVYGAITNLGKSGTPNATNLDLKRSPLTNASAMVFINGLANVTTAKNITLKASTYDTLTEEQIAVATSKGWSVIRSA